MNEHNTQPEAENHDTAMNEFNNKEQQNPPTDITPATDPELEATHEEEEDELEAAKEEEEYDHLSREELIALSKKLLESDDLGKVERAFKKIKVEIDRIREEEVNIAKQKFVAENGEEEGFEFKGSPDLDQFYANYKELRQRKQKQFNDRKKERENNLATKNSLLNELKKLVEESGSLDKLKEIQKKWKETGAVPKEDADALYQSYSALIDRFYDQKNIEKDLKDLDRKRNLDAKLELCAKAEALVDSPNVNEAIGQLAKLHDEYKHIGPVPLEQKDNIWNRFKVASDKLYERKRQYAEQFKTQLKGNMEAKQALCLKIEAFASFDSDRIKDWNEKSKEIAELQKEWEKIGPLPREIAKDVNKQFWHNFKQFFNHKNRFFERLESFRAENLAKKQALCEQAEALQESSDWEKATDEIMKLQEAWKEVGPVPEAQRDVIFNRFKLACDRFFERRRNRRSEQDKEFDINYKRKVEICQQIADLAKVADSIETFRQLRDEFNSIGFVPKKHIVTINDKFMNAVDAYLDNAVLTDEADREKFKLELMIETFKGTPAMAKKLSTKEQAIRKQIQTIENDIALWENNLQFFASSKTADKLRDEFKHKIDDAHSKLNALKKQLRLIRNM